MWPCGEHRLPLGADGADVGLWALRSWEECSRELRAGALRNPLGLANCRVAETQGLTPDASISGQPRPHVTVNLELVKRLAQRAAVRHRRRPVGPLTRHPRGEHPTGETRKIHPGTEACEHVSLTQDG